VGNVVLKLRGNDTVREATIWFSLHHAIQNGMTMGEGRTKTHKDTTLLVTVEHIHKNTQIWG
jgi:hypothetical protein